MTRFSLSSLSKILLFLLLITVFLFIYNLPVIFEKEFLDIKNIIEMNAEEAFFGKDVTIEKIGFLPHGELILHNVKIYDREKHTYYGIARRCHINFKILPLILRRTLIVTKVTFREPILFLPAKKIEFPQEEEMGFSDYKFELDSHFLIKVFSGSAVFARSDYISGEIGFTGWIQLYGKKGFASEGNLDLGRYQLEDYILNDLLFFSFVDTIGYRLKASLTGNTLSLDEVVLDFHQFKIAGNGVVENYNTDPLIDINLALKELDLPENAYLKSRLLVEGIRNFIVNIKGALSQPTWLISMDELRSRFGYLPRALRIDNFYCNLKASREKLLVEECSFFLNDFPVGLTLDLSIARSPNIELDIISYPGQVPSLRPFNPLNFEFSFSGDRFQDSIKGKTSLHIEKPLFLGPRLARDLDLRIDDISCNFLKGSVVSPSGDPVVPLALELNDIFYESSMVDSEIRVNLESLHALLYPEKGRAYLSDLKITGYEGSLEGEGMLEFAQVRPGAFLDFRFNDFSIDELVDIVDLDYDLGGRLSGKAILDTKALAFLKGDADILGGHIRDVEVLNLIADFLSVPSLKDIYFDEASLGFSFSKVMDNILFNDIKLRSEDIYLDGDLEFNEKVKIKGDVLIRLSTRLLKESFKMRLLFLLMGERLPYADFEFEIAGFLKSPRIKWLETKFRQGVMRFLPKSGQKTMERDVKRP